jgi:hypothetical protein
MNSIVSWLSQRKWINAFILIGYFVAVVLPHKLFGTFLNTQVFKGITRAEYNQIVLSFAIGVLLLFCTILFRNIYRHINRNLILAYLSINVIFAALVMRYLFVINIEVIHYPQYALFALLCFPLINNYHQTLIWTTIAGAIDEAYQYFYLAPKDTSYYDMNDVVTNLIGAVFGLLFLWSFTIPNKNLQPFWNSKGFFGVVAIIILVLVLNLSGILSIHPSDETPYQLLRKWPKGFWTNANHGVTYHIIQPIEGAIVTLGLWGLYFKLGNSKT